MAGRAKPIPQGYHSVTPYLVVNDAARAIEFYKRAFGATEVMRMPGPAGKLAHVELKLGDSMMMLSDEMPNRSDEMPDSTVRSPQTVGGTTVGVFLYVEDVDKVFKQAKSAGAKEKTPLADMFWGDRYGTLSDPFGHTWSLATHIEDVAPEEMAKRAEAARAEFEEHARTAR
jgi:PhnB protein